MENNSNNSIYWSHAHSLENVVMSEGLMARYFLTWSVTWKERVKPLKHQGECSFIGWDWCWKTGNTQRREQGVGLQREGRRKKQQRGGGGVYIQVWVCVCDRCFMVREFVLLRGGVSKYPAAGYRMAGRGSGRLLFHTKTHCWYFSPYLTEGHMDQITRKHGHIL